MTENQLYNIISESIQKVLNEKKVIKIKKPQSMEPAPMSQTPPMDPNMGMPMDNGMGGDPNMAGDMNAPIDNSMDSTPMGDNAGLDAMGGEAPDDMPSDGTGDDTMSMFNQLSDDDKEAARGYIKSMLKRDETQPDADMQNNMPTESVIFTKKQINKLNEVFGQDSKKEPKLDTKMYKKSKSSPFNSPKFN